MGDTSNGIVRETLLYSPIRYFFFQIPLYIFFIRSYREFSSEDPKIKRKNKKFILIEKN
jgi:hypothetical protein